jgi:hypothetical protein
MVICRPGNQKSSAITEKRKADRGFFSSLLTKASQAALDQLDPEDARVERRAQTQAAKPRNHATTAP